jgi:cytochrome c-type biogenesis protein CcmH/NrfG
LFHLGALVLLAAIHLGALAQANSGVPEITAALGKRDFDKALALLRPALQTSPRNAQLWMLQGLAYSGKGDLDSALNSYQAALKISPDYLAALEGAAQLEYEASRTDAIPLLEHILQLRPRETTSHAMLAVLAYKSGDCVKAVDHFAQSRPILDSQPGALQEYGFCLLKLKQTEPAIQLFQELLR